MISQIIHSLLTLVKSFWTATVSTAFGISSFLLLIGLSAYFKIDVSNTLLTLTQWLAKNWLWFWITLFICDIITNFKEVWKDE